MKTFEERIEWELTDPERQAAGEELARDLARRDRIDESRKEAAAEYKARFEEVTGRIDALAEEVRSGRRTRVLTMREERDDQAGVMLVIRTDTGEVVRSRAFTDSERQPNLIAFEGGTEENAEA